VIATAASGGFVFAEGLEVSWRRWRSRPYRNGF